MNRVLSRLAVSVIFVVALNFGMSEYSAARSDISNSAVAVSLAPEGAEGSLLTTQFSFTVRRTGDLSGTCSVRASTADGTAFAPEDYIANSVDITFAPGQETAVVPVSVKGEIYHEFDETFFLDLTNAVGCTVAAGRPPATIYNDEPPVAPGLCFNGIEGDVLSWTNGMPPNGVPNGEPNAAIRTDDLVRLRRVVLGLDQIVNACAFRQADINGDCGDGRVDVADVTVLRQWILEGGGQRQACGPIP